MIVVNGVRKSWEILRSSVAFNCSFFRRRFQFYPFDAQHADLLHFPLQLKVTVLMPKPTKNIRIKVTIYILSLKWKVNLGMVKKKL